MTKQGYKVVDIEPHLHEPFDLWERNLPEPYRSRVKFIAPPRDEWHLGPMGSARWGPYVERDGDTFAINVMRTSDGEWTGHKGYHSLVWKQAIRRWEQEPRLLKAQNPHSTPDVYLRDFDTEGVDIGVLMPTYGGPIVGDSSYDPDLALAMCQVYNEWVYEFTRADPTRLKWWALVPLQNPKLAAQEARRCMEELDAVGVTAKDSGEYLANDPVLEPFWEELDRLHAPVGFHGFCEGGKVKRIDHDRARSEFIKRFGGPHATATAGLIFGGVLDRYPNIKPVFMESGANGVPYLLEQMDDAWSLFGPDQDFTLSMWPSEYYRLRCFATTYAEGLLKLTLEHMGADSFVFSTDYPHHDSPFPNGVNNFLAVEEISEESKRKILWDNALRLFDFKTR